MSISVAARFAINKPNGGTMMKGSAIKALSLVAVLLVPTISVHANATTEITNLRVPVSFQDLIPCANHGNGEIVDFSGTIHAVLSSTTNGNNIHLNTVVDPQGIKGIGETTGDVWVATGVTHQDTNASVDAFPYETTVVNNFRLVNGQEGSFLVHESIHVTINADGTLTAFVDNSSTSCK